MLVKYVAIDTFQNFQMGPMQHLYSTDRETCISNIFLVGQVLMDFGTFAPHESYDHSESPGSSDNFQSIFK